MGGIGCFMSLWKPDKTSPAQIIMLGFFLLIAAGTALLMLPISSSGPESASLLDALFTATSATCVTGLVVQDTAMSWSFFGHLVILILIQIGGMGVITVAVAVFIFSGKKISLKQRWVMQESISAPQVGGIIRQTRFILLAVLLIEGIGALLLAFRFCEQFGFARGLWYSIFHSVSAFCNAGFDLMGTQESPYASLVSYAADPLVNLVICALIIIGGLGFLTWRDIRDHRHHIRAYYLQSKLVLSTTILLLGLSFCYYFFYEFHLSPWAGLSGGERFLAACFQAVTPRTAGFNTISLSQLSQPSQLFTILLMLIGGSPASTAGGFKTTTLAVLLLNTRAIFRRRESAQCFGRRIPEDVLRNASAIFILYLLLFFVGGFLISCLDQIPLMGALFEAASAVGTVGLSLGYTPELSAASHLILIFLMYFGRVGGLTMIYAVTARSTPGISQLPQERVTIG